MGMLLGLNTLAQEELQSSIRPAFRAPQVFDIYTDAVAGKNRLMYSIQHRFGSLDTGSEDLWGFYAPSNIRMGVYYGLGNGITLAYFNEKSFRSNEFIVGKRIISQKKDGSPINLSFWTVLAIDARKKEKIGEQFKTNDRFSYHQYLSLGKRFSYNFALLGQVSWHHSNRVNQYRKHDMLNLKLAANYRLNHLLSLNAFAEKGWQANMGKTYSETQSVSELMYGMALAIDTHTHNFQVFVSNSYYMNPQRDFWYAGESELGKLRLGFNITARF